ncbi:MAG: YggT family protein [Rhizobiales bacterium]|nr:YggT family protein [Hyphomicrobiales bacterium]
MPGFAALLVQIIGLYIWLIVASAILSWLVAFNVVNSRNNVVRQIGEFLYRITEPALAPIRRFMPDLGGIDISPIVLIFALVLLQDIVIRVFAW